MQTPHEVVIDLVSDTRVLFVVGVSSDELSHPGGSSHEFSGGARLNEAQVLLDRALSVHVDVDVAEIVLDEVHEAREAFAARHDLVHAHLDHLRLRVVVVVVDVATEVELLVETCVAFLRPLQVHVDFRDRYEHVKFEAENGSCE